jgi:hypothetical protein
MDGLTSARLVVVTRAADAMTASRDLLMYSCWYCEEEEATPARDRQLMRTNE